MSCIICNECSNPLIKVTEKGLSSLIEFSKKRNEDGIYQLLIKAKTENSHVLVHENCREQFNDKRKLTIINTLETLEPYLTGNNFFFFFFFFFCNQHCIEDYKNPSRRDWHLASY